jgi:hypothetical protein
MKSSPMGFPTSALCAIAIALASCSSASSDWKKASTENTVSAYQNFVDAHPKDEHVAEAQAMILQMQDDGRWLEAQRSATTETYQQYLQQFPKGTHVQAAQDAITAIDRAAAWKVAQNEPTAASIQAFLQKYPFGPEADQAKDKLKTLTGYMVRLARERSETSAKRKLAELKSRFEGQLHDLFIVPAANGKSFDVVSATDNEQDARDKCHALKRKHQSCEVIRR